jgi:hypothetical protein
MNRGQFQMAMSATVGALLFTVAGILGYAVNWHVSGSWGHRAGAPVWWEIWLGLGFALLALVTWRRLFRERIANLHKGLTRVPTVCEACGESINAWVRPGSEARLTTWKCPNPECRHEQKTTFNGKLRLVAFGMVGPAAMRHLASQRHRPTSR